jgi:hypothetical protein
VVVKSSRPIQRRRERYLVRSAELKDIIRDQREIGADHNAHFSSELLLLLTGPFHNVTNHVESQQRFATLELEFQVRGRATENEVYGSVSDLLCHVTRIARRAFMGYLAIYAGIVAAERRNQHM